MPTNYSTMAQPHKKLPTISPSYGIKLVTKKKKMKQKLCACCLKKKKDYSKVEECNIIKQLLNAAYRYTHVSPPTYTHMHTNTHTPQSCPSFALTTLTNHTLLVYGTTAFR